MKPVQTRAVFFSLSLMPCTNIKTRHSKALMRAFWIFIRFLTNYLKVQTMTEALLHPGWSFYKATRWNIAVIHSKRNRRPRCRKYILRQTNLLGPMILHVVSPSGFSICLFQASCIRCATYHRDFFPLDTLASTVDRRSLLLGEGAGEKVKQAAKKSNFNGNYFPAQI